MSESGSFDIYNRAVLTIADNLFREWTHHTSDTFSALSRTLNFFSYLSPCVRGALVNFKQVFFKIEEHLKTSFMRLQSNQVKRTPQDAISELIIWKMNPLDVLVRAYGKAGIRNPEPEPETEKETEPEPEPEPKKYNLETFLS